MALLAKREQPVDITPDAASFWFGNGLVHVS
jgi:hypothetical protein